MNESPWTEAPREKDEYDLLEEYEKLPDLFDRAIERDEDAEEAGEDDPPGQEDEEE